MLCIVRIVRIVSSSIGVYVYFAEIPKEMMRRLFVQFMPNRDCTRSIAGVAHLYRAIEDMNRVYFAYMQGVKNIA